MTIKCTALTIVAIASLFYPSGLGFAEDAITAPAQKTIGGQPKMIPSLAVLNSGGATLSGFNLPTAQKLFQRVGKLDQIRAKAKPGVTPAQLATQISTAAAEKVALSGGSVRARGDV